VQTTRCTRGIAACALVLATFSVVLGEPAAFLAAGALLFFIIYRAGVYHARVVRIAGTLAVSRVAGRLMIRQGSTIDVLTKVTCTLPGHMAIRITDLPPPGSAVTDGAVERTLSSPGAASTALSYRIRILSRGDTDFSGLSIRVSDRFFSEELTFREGNFAKPVLHVQPTGIFEAVGARGTTGEMEYAKRSAPSGYSVYSFREYATGDDLRRVDWKLSAKYQKLFVKQYTSHIGEPALIIVDLPDQSGSENTQVLNRMVTAIEGAMEKALRQYRTVSLLVVSGGNIIRFLPAEQNLSKLMVAVRNMRPIARSHHFYRIREEFALRSRVSGIERDLSAVPPSADERAYLSNLGSVYNHFMKDRQMTAFEAQVDRAMASVHEPGAYLFSMLEGDLSHIRMIVYQARRRKTDIYLQVPKEAYTPGVLKSVLESGVESIEVIQ